MKLYMRWIIPFVVIVFLFSSYWSFTYTYQASSIEQGIELRHVKNELPRSINDQDIIFRDDKRQASSDVVFIESMDYKIGDSIRKVFDTYGNPNEKGMYEGGPYYEYGDITYFTEPNSEEIVAIAYSGEKLLAMDEEILESLTDKTLIHKGMNEMDGFWMEIYRMDEVDVMIERKDEEGAILYLWVTKENIFLNK